VLEAAGDVPLRVEVALREARCLDREDVLATDPHQVGDVEAVREEVALGVTEVRPVEPDVGLVEDAVEGDEQPLTVLRAGVLEAVAVEQRPVGRGERGVAAPVRRDRDLGPAGVVELQADAVAAQLVVHRRGDPPSRQLHRRDRIRNATKAPPRGDDMVGP
jgi:hypothetical protein